MFQHEATERKIAVPGIFNENYFLFMFVICPVTTKEIDLRHRFYSNNRRLNVCLARH